MIGEPTGRSGADFPAEGETADRTIPRNRRAGLSHPRPTVVVMTAAAEKVYRAIGGDSTTADSAGDRLGALGERVVLVEDDPDMRLLVAFLLARVSRGAPGRLA